MFVFLCFAMKAIHMEILSDLTSEALITTLKASFLDMKNGGNATNM